MVHNNVPEGNRTNARRMRRAMTDAELKLWNALRAHRLMGLAFRRQMPIAGHIVDFACPNERLVVELDGSQHGDDDAVRRDAGRTERLERLGWTVVRFWNDDVSTDLDGVCRHLLAVLAERRARQDRTVVDAIFTPRPTSPPSVLPDISPSRGEIVSFGSGSKPADAPNETDLPP